MKHCRKELIQYMLKLLQKFKSLGPGLLFASTAIGTSHLVLATRAGAHHGLIFIWIIVATLILKYPFFEFGPRYAIATNYSLIRGYEKQGKLAVALFFLIIGTNMFAVVGAISAVCGGLLSIILGLEIAIPMLVGIILVITTCILIFGGYALLDKGIKVLTMILLVTVVICFLAVLQQGPHPKLVNFEPNSIFSETGLVLVLSLIGWMPSGMETSTMNSIWVVEKQKISGQKQNLKESLFDFRLGYTITVILAVLFLVIGAFSVYGTGSTLDGNTTSFSSKLIHVFTSNIGEWSYPMIAITAFGTIYGTLITAWDAFSRSFVRTLRVLKFKTIEKNMEQDGFLRQMHMFFIPIIGLGGFLLFYFFAESMIKILEFATIMSFLTAPFIAFLNLRAIQSAEVPLSHRPNERMLWFSRAALSCMVLFSVYYIFTLMV